LKLMDLCMERSVQKINTEPNFYILFLIYQFLKAKLKIWRTS